MQPGEKLLPDLAGERITVVVSLQSLCSTLQDAPNLQLSQLLAVNDTWGRKAAPSIVVCSND